MKRNLSLFLATLTLSTLVTSSIPTYAYEPNIIDTTETSSSDSSLETNELAENPYSSFIDETYYNITTDYLNGIIDKLTKLPASAELKPFSGLDTPVKDYVLEQDETKNFLYKLTDMLEFLIPNYKKEGKRQLIISIGCTGGRHRSVAIANEIYKNLHEKNYDVYPP